MMKITSVVLPITSVFYMFYLCVNCIINCVFTGDKAFIRHPLMISTHQIIIKNNNYLRLEIVHLQLDKNTDSRPCDL